MFEGENLAGKSPVQRATGVTLAPAEQNMHFCLGVASHAAVIDKGQIVYRDTIEGLRANEGITSRYLAV